MRLSQKHGVNPCVALCIVCGEGKAVVLAGLAGERMAREMGREDGEMPREAVFDIDPCDKCKAAGVAFIEMTSEDSDAKPTGRVCLLKDEVVRRNVQPPELMEDILKKRMAVLSSETWRAIGLPTE